MAAQIRIGTSGWHYKHWCGPFYPKKCPSSQWFELYARLFDTVEVPILICAAIPHLRREERRDPERVVRARPLLRRRRAADRACRARARWEAPLRPSLFSARVIAWERLLEGRRVVR